MPPSTPPGMAATSAPIFGQKPNSSANRAAAVYAAVE